MSALRELIASFGIEVDSKELKEAGEHISDFKEMLKKTGEVLAEAFAVDQLKEFIESQIEAGAQLKVMADRLGVGTDELQAMQLAAGEAGVSVDALTTGLRFLNKNMAEAAKGSGDSAGLFRELGISLKEQDGSTRAAGDVLGDLADHLAEMPDAAKKTEIAMKLLGRGGAELIPMLNRGGAAFEEAKAKMEELGGGMSKEFVEQAHEAEAANVRLEFSMKSLRARIATALIPGFSELVEWFTRQVSAVQRFTKETNVVTTALEFFGVVAGIKAVQSVRALAKAFGLLKPSVLETVAALARFALPLLLVGALYVLFDDLWTLLHGGQSVIGDTLDKLFGIGTANEFAMDLNETLAATLDILPTIGKAIFETIVLPFKLAADVIAGLVGAVLGAFGQDIDAKAGGGGSFMGGLSEMGDNLAKDWNHAGAAGDAVVSRGRDDLTLNREGRRRKRAREAYGDDFTGGPMAVGGDGLDPRSEYVPLFGGANANTRSPTYTGPMMRDPYMVVPTTPGAAGGERDRGDTVQVTQHIKNEIEVQSSAADGKEVAGAVGQGLATPMQRATERGVRAVRKS